MATPSESEVANLAKLVRLCDVAAELVAELRRGPLDEDGRRAVAQLHEALLLEVASAVSDPLIEEMQRLFLVPSDTSPSDAELRIAEAQLLGWARALREAQLSAP